ncbi:MULTISPECIES: hypothetical protein [unclassified Thioalkalivibrio]|uniref:hypothetical protein n=1 Tax=unclassified Thioalkalivibrio TaxID=2621013 RepID=UPI0003712DEF|nr:MULTISPECIES: hypothetical protein [unclassified Thioalkalivibrio]
MFTLDAWLENPAPSLRIIDDHSRRVVAEWRGQELRDLLDSGIIAPTDCCGPQSRDTVHETTRDLILEACLEGITVQRRAPATRPDAPVPLASQTADNAGRPGHRVHQPLARQPAAPGNRSRQLTCARAAGAAHPTKKPREIAKGRVLHVAFRKWPPLH